MHLFHLYARSHFWFAVKAAALAVLFGFVTALPGYYPLGTWGIWVLILAMMLSPWFFNPQSFRASTLLPHFPEWLLWLDEEPGITNGMGSWRVWHVRALFVQRHMSAGARIATFLASQVSAVEP